MGSALLEHWYCLTQLLNAKTKFITSSFCLTKSNLSPHSGHSHSFLDKSGWKHFWQINLSGSSGMSSARGRFLEQAYLTSEMSKVTSDWSHNIQDKDFTFADHATVLTLPGTRSGTWSVAPASPASPAGACRPRWGSSCLTPPPPPW